MAVNSGSQPKNLTEPFFLVISGEKRKSGNLAVRTSPSFIARGDVLRAGDIAPVAVALQRDFHRPLPLLVPEIALSFQVVLEIW